MSGFKCLECGRKFKTVKAAEKASYDGCPGCGGVDIDIDIDTDPKPTTKVVRGNSQSGMVSSGDSGPYGNDY